MRVALKVRLGGMEVPNEYFHLAISRFVETKGRLGKKRKVEISAGRFRAEQGI